ncbi:hypothetical protein P152DRAFT_429641 [Eremomyces bilateralis CBS 781.70]|uniref:Uncharacterized protein n=1 Tax=Eremomyces bilateralis CBS 781.70 TaxID=1392243 RepID=A0A6G1GCH2_9PEZI|nr:uncharacterized protein P152DRAFT_429641 [Eremomyces bilateralis CBS 781.70]KAF1815549.1 hypothetical protein P152DRAFT_429641 [Eremomyces bilateralis CBS 781.70]
MRFLSSAVLGFLATQFSQVLAADPASEIPILNAADEIVSGGSEKRAIAVTATASFPESEVFGIKLVNGHPTTAVVTFNNAEDFPANVLAIGGTLAQASSDQIVRNLTFTQYGVEVPAGETVDLTYAFATEMHPQELQLALSAIVTDNEAGFYTLSIFNGTVSVVEAPISLLDPQILFLYVFLSGVFVATCAFIYNTWVAPLFPKKSAPKSRKPETPRPVATTTGAQGYDESWIPAHHVNRPEAKRSKSSGTKKSKA